ncbi:FecR family protein [Mucilaginibacter yixingensis]|uniref:FecR family protein n=1 Tax=Mucilaginibacter yixingensis TaxID=1295612 RepID=A0A2T5JFA8_9SPHI|nr:FecR family protein [Mucilaginibacter yixingensis]PTR01111.1 FecR family protein [Mucilaginibacter yixingensis]
MLEKDLVQLLHQESFLNYCFGRDDHDVRHWKQWVEEHPEDALQIEELRRTVMMMAKTSQEMLRDRHFEELQQKMAGVPMLPAKKKSFWKISYAAAAAVLIMAAGVALFYLRGENRVQNNVIAQKKEIKPGSNKAILTLANGKKIVLTDSVNGQIAVQAGIKISKTAQGQIIYELSDSGVGDNASAPVFNTVEAPTGGQWEVVLPDRSKVWLNARSSLTYPTYFAGNERRVALKGEAYFEITHNETMPFRVTSKTQTVEVLGTHFNIMAYDNEQLMKTTLLQGSVRISDHGRTRILVPGEQAQVSDGALQVTSDVDIEDVVSWKNGYFKFNESLESIMRKVARWYDVDVVYANNTDPSVRFGGKISRYKNLASALKIMELTGNIHFKVEGRRVTVMQ